MNWNLKFYRQACIFSFHCYGLQNRNDRLLESRRFSFRPDVEEVPWGEQAPSPLTDGEPSKFTTVVSNVVQCITLMHVRPANDFRIRWMLQDDPQNNILKLLTSVVKCLMTK